jgi:hypothetical protein
MRRLHFKYDYQAAIMENQLRAITPELMAGSTPNFNQVPLSTGDILRFLHKRWALYIALAISFSLALTSNIRELCVIISWMMQEINTIF